MSKKIKRSLLSILSLAMVCVVALGFVGCKKSTEETPTQQAAPAIVWTIDKAYAQAQSEGFEGTIEEFLTHLSNISDIKLDDLGRLIFTLGDGTVITAGTVAAGAPGRGVESVETTTDRWGLVVTNVFTYTDGGTTTTTYTTSPMYGREYDITSAEELNYLVANGVEYVVLKNDINMGNVNYTKTLTNNLYVNLNGRTVTANTISFTSSSEIQVGFMNGILQTTEGIEVSVPNGELIFENVVAFDKNGEIELDASTSSVYLSGSVAFFEGEFEGLTSPTPATVKIPADTRIVVEEDASVVLEKIEVVEVQDYTKPLVVMVYSESTEPINVAGNVMVYGVAGKVVATGETTQATVKVDDYVYSNLNDAMVRFHEGAVVELIGNTTWNLTSDITIGYQIAIRTNSFVITGDYLDYIKTADEYYSQITYKPQGGDGQTVDTIVVLKCMEHTYVKGYCSTCDHEDTSAAFVVRVDGRKYLTFEEIYEKLPLTVGESPIEIVLLNDVEWVSETERTIDFEFTIKNPQGFSLYGTGLDNVTLAETYYWANTANEIKVLHCTEHSYILGWCRFCNAEDKTADKYVATIGTKKYESISQIIDTDHLAGSTVELIDDAEFDDELDVDFEFTINLNGNTLYGLDNLVFADTYYRDKVAEETIVGGAVVVKQCLSHTYTEYGYCKDCNHENEVGNFVAQIDNLIVDGKNLGTRKYLSLEHMVEQGHFVDGVTIDLLKNTTWNSETNIAIDFTFTINLNGKVLDGTAVSKFVLEDTYYMIEEPDVKIQVLHCTDHGEFKNDKEVYTGYCDTCRLEDPDADFVIQAGNRKFISFENMIEQEFFFEDGVVITLLDNVVWDLSEDLVVENRLTINLGEFTITGTALGDLADLTDDKLVCADTYYRVDTANSISVRRCPTLHSYEGGYGYCTICGHKNENETFVAKIGERYYLSFADILAQNHFVNGVVVDMLADTTWDLESPLTVTFNMAVNANGHSLGGNALSQISAGVGYVKESEGGVFRIYECTVHNFADGTCTHCNTPEVVDGGDE